MKHPTLALERKLSYTIAHLSHEMGKGLNKDNSERGMAAELAAWIHYASEKGVAWKAGQKKKEE